jgi:two-component system, NarL family, response regulator NreC
LIIGGLNNRQIAERLYLSIKTVESHRTNLMHKLNLHSRADLIKFAMDKGLIDINP